MPAAKLAHAKGMRGDPTPAEHRLWERLRERRLGVKFRRQAPMWGYIADFYCNEFRLCVEADGGYHDPATDWQRDQALAQHGIKTIRYTNRQILSDTDAVVADIVHHLTLAGFNGEPRERRAREQERQRAA